jgi:hypothetical protein
MDLTVRGIRAKAEDLAEDNFWKGRRNFLKGQGIAISSAEIKSLHFRSAATYR